MTFILSEKKVQKIGHIDLVLRDYFAANPSLTKMSAKKMMTLFIQKGIFFKDNQQGLAIRNLLRQLDQEDKLHLLIHVTVFEIQ